MFLHERGAYNTLYFTFYFGSLMVGPIIAGSMAVHVGWRNFWWLNVALHGAIFIGLLFLFPETKWHRLHPKELLKLEAANQSGSSEKITSEKKSELDSGVEHYNPATQQDKILGELTESKTAERDPYLGRGKPNKKQFALFVPNAHPFKSILLDLWIPWKLFAFPIVSLLSP